MTKKETVFSKDLPNKKISVEREFEAPLEQVWKAWTESEILDEWWAPKPYRAVTKKMDFRAGGFWLYCMVGPTDDKQWCKEQYETVDPMKKITNSVAFCDEEGILNTAFPLMYWKKAFSSTGNDTTVSIEITFDKEADMEMIMGMGFQEGFNAGMNNLDQYLSTQLK